MKDIIFCIRTFFGVLFIGMGVYFLSLPFYNYFTAENKSIKNFFINEKPKTSYSGIIINKLNPVDDYTHKGTTSLSYNPTFIIHFKELGVVEVNPTTNDYYRYKIGDKISYSFNNPTDFSYMVIELITLLSAFIWVVLSIVAIIMFIGWVFGINSD